MFSELFADNRQLREQCQQQQCQIQKLQTESQHQKAEIERVTQRCNQHETLINELRGRIAGEKMLSVHNSKGYYLFEQEMIYPQQDISPNNRYHRTKKLIMTIVKNIIISRNNH
jgi:hypothetical protein